MAHSAASNIGSEINYLIEDNNGKFLKVVKEIKREPTDANNKTTTLYVGNNSNMGAYNQISTSNQPQFTRIQSYNHSNTDNATYTTIINTQSGNGNNNSNNNTNSGARNLQVNSIKYEYSNDDYAMNNAHSTIVKSEDRFTKYTPNSNIMKTKSKLHTTNSTPASVQKKRKQEKVGKGLRHFSMKVCEKVKAKGTTTYNEVADELVNEEIHNNTSFDDTTNCDHKNIRRRVYDALNVLMAMQIISKDKKEIRWIGLPSSSIEEYSLYEKLNEEKRENIRQKEQQLAELILHQIAFKNLIERNKKLESEGNIPTPNSSIELPFIIVNTHKSTKINCSVANDKSEYIFKFDEKFEMHDDAEVLKRMGLLNGLDKGECSAENIERAKSMVPPNFEKYVEAMAYGKADSDLDEDLDDPSQYSEMANDDSSQGFKTERNIVTAGSGNSGIDGGGGGGGISSSNSSNRKLYADLDEDEEFLDNSDID